MSPLYTYNSQLLVENNALAISENCCCSGDEGTEGCQDQCQDLAIVAGGTISDQGPCDTAPVIAYLQSIGYTNVVVNIAEEPLGAGFVVYTYTYNGQCCGQQQGSSLLSGLCGFEGAGTFVSNCVCDESITPSPIE